MESELTAMAEKHALKEEFLRLLSTDRDFRRAVWKELVGDRDNLDALNEALHEYVRDGGRLPT